MILRFPIQTIKAKSVLAQKLVSLNFVPFFDRIFAKLSFVKSDKSLGPPLRAIVNTGAIISLFPGYLLNEYPDIQTENHTLWGIVDTPECHLTTKLAKVPIILIDIDGKESPALEILAAFSDSVNIPPLLGMKGLLDSYQSNIDVKNRLFEIKII